MVRRDNTPYADREVRAVHVAGAVDVSTPVAGFFRLRMSRSSVAVGVEIRFGPPLDPVTGEEMDRSWRWLAFVNGEPFADFDRIWPQCAATPITEQECRRYCTRQDWARKHAPDSAYAEAGRKLDPLSLQNPMPF